MLEATFWGDELKGVDFVPYRIGADFAPRVVPYAAPAAGCSPNFWRFSGLGALSQAQMTPRRPRRELGGVDDGRDVPGGVVPGVRRAAEPRGGKPASAKDSWSLPGRRADGGADPGALGRPDQGGPDRDRAAPGAEATGTTVPTPTRSRDDHAPQVPPLRRVTSRPRSAASRSGAGRRPVPRGSSPPKATNTTGQPRRRDRDAARRLEQHGDAGRVVLGPGRDGHGVEVRAHHDRAGPGRSRAAGDHVDRAAGRDRHAPRVPGRVRGRPAAPPRSRGRSAAPPPSAPRPGTPARSPAAGRSRPRDGGRRPSPGCWRRREDGSRRAGRSRSATPWAAPRGRWTCSSAAPAARSPPVTTPPPCRR